jgi:dTDP-4-dehydrorhamnose reductase
MIEGWMRILLLGKNGQLGWELQRTLAPLGEIIAWDVDELDLTLIDNIAPAVQNVKPRVIVNASAYTDVDRAEQEPEIAYSINAIAPKVLAHEAKELGAWFLHFSTDFVFNGEKGSPYIETDDPDPINVYGHTKREGERGVVAADGLYLILRTSWVYSLRKESFVTKVLQWARGQERMQVVDDQIGSPTWARMLAEITAALLAKSQAFGEEWLEERRGLYHVAGKGAVSRFEWAKEILRLDPKREEQIVRSVTPVSSERFPTPAQRPRQTALECSKFERKFMVTLPSWDHMLNLAMEVLR